jgi:hypothetical protein
MPDNKLLMFMYVSGPTTETGVVNTPLNSSVVFLKSKDIHVTSDYWRILNFPHTRK